MKKTTSSSRTVFSILLFFLILPSAHLRAQFKLEPKPLTAYSFTFSSSSASSFVHQDFKDSDKFQADNKTFLIDVLGRDADKILVQITSGNKIMRRQIKTNGELLSSPELNLPPFLVFPDAPLRKGKTIAFQKSLDSKFGKIPSTWYLTLIEEDVNLAKMSFRAVLPGTNTQTIKKTYHVTGEIAFDKQEGMPQRVVWKTAYKTEFYVKEIAVVRHFATHTFLSSHELTMTGKIKR